MCTSFRPEGTPRSSGRASAALVELGHNVLAIEPGATMATILNRRLICPSYWAEPSACRCPRTPRPRPGGLVILLWNSTDPSVRWIGKVGRLIRRVNSTTFDNYADDSPWSPQRFDPPVRLMRTHAFAITISDFWRTSRSHSLR